MNTYGLFPLIDALDRLTTLMTADRDFTARAFGLLLLGKRFDDKTEEFQDPTDLLLNHGLEVPGR